MSSPQIVCFGEILFDFLADQLGLPYGQVKSWTPYPGGAPANVATALAKLGTSSGFVGCVGQDDIGDLLVKLLQDAGVDTSGVQRHASALTRGVYVTRSQTGDRVFAGFGETDTTEFADTRLQANQIPIKLFEKAEYLVLGTLELAYPDSHAAITQALDLAAQHSTKIVLDVNWRPVFWPNPTIAPQTIQEIIHRADIIKLSDEEAEWLFATTDPSAIVDRLSTSQGVMVTAGENGCSYCIGGHTGKLPAFSVSVQDTTGAGDSFLAGFLHQLCQRGIQSLTDPQLVLEMMTYASAVGALTTTKAGAIAAQPTAAEVKQFLLAQGIQQSTLS
jgi:fructokinase